MATVLAGLLLVLAAAPAPAWKAGKTGKRPHLSHPRHGAQIAVGPIAVPRGQELTACTYLKLPSRRDLDVHRVTIAVSGGTHHVHLYRPQDPSFARADGEETCNFALDFSQWQLVLASQNLLLDWKLPPGVAFHFRAREQLAAQTHFVDNGLLRTPTGEGWAVFDLWAMSHRKVKSYAGSIFGQDRDVVVPPTRPRPRPRAASSRNRSRCWRSPATTTTAASSSPRRPGTGRVATRSTSSKDTSTLRSCASTA